MASASRRADHRTDVPQATAIIVTHNRADLLRRSVRSVLRQQPRAPRLIVIDNASTDHTSLVLREECPNGTVIRLAHNVGCGPARNIGAEAADSEMLVFLDDDSELAADAVASATRAMWEDDRIGALVVSIIENGKPLGSAATGARCFTNVCIGQGVFRRSAFLKAGSYPPDFMYGAEEMDLSLRLLDCGYDIVVEPNVVLFHAADQRTRRPWPELEVQRNMLRVVLMRAPACLLVPWTSKKLYDLVSAAFRTGRPQVVLSEFVALPGIVIRSLHRRRTIPWEVFAVWRYLATRVVSSSDYRREALREYPTRWQLLMSYLHSAPSGRGA